MLDIGSGTLRQLAKSQHSFLEIDSLFLSHFHIDHIGDFIPLLFTYKYAKPEFIGEPKKKLNLFAHKNWLNYQHSIFQVFRQWLDLERIVFFDINDHTFNFENFSVSGIPIKHSTESLVYKFVDHNNKSFVYTGDTGFFPELVDICKNVDGLLIECSFPNKIAAAKYDHLYPEAISELIRAARPKQVFITHIYPENDTSHLRESIKTPDCTKVWISEDLKSYLI